MSSKTIQINPDLFKMSANKSRKRAPKSTDPDHIPKLRIREKTSTPMNKTSKTQILKYIRQQQQRKYDEMMSGLGTAAEPSQPVSTPASQFETDFKQSLDYLNTITEKQKMVVKPTAHNATLKHNSLLLQPSVMSSIINENIQVSAPSNMFTMPTPAPGSPPVVSSLEYNPSDPSITLHPPVFGAPQNISPQFGCLKNGSLPTYRAWRMQTQKQYPTLSSHLTGGGDIPTPSLFSSSSSSSSTLPNTSIDSQPAPLTAMPVANGLLHQIAAGSELKPQSQPQSDVLNRFQSPDWMQPKRMSQQNMMMMKKLREHETQNKPMKKRVKHQRRTMRRTFHVGKSKFYPKVGVLVSNKTLRTNVSSHAHKLKQVPIEEVRKTLIKRGLIKVGSIAPNDVLRKMYESVSLLCGTLQNHNPDNLIYNYFNANAEL